MRELRHIVLLGDSIFDNKAYVGAGPAVIDQVQEALGDDWQATLLAVDGDIASDVPAQILNLPPAATHLVVSAGGNDALSHVGVFGTPVSTVGEALLEVSEIQAAFEASYTRMLEAVLAVGLPTAICTIYDPNFGDRVEQRMAVAALAAFNDRITRLAFSRGLPVIDLRTLFSQSAHYANPIEPSSAGGKLIAERIAELVHTHDFAGRTGVWC